MRRLVFSLLMICGCCNAVPLTFRVKVVGGVSRHLAYLEYPPYLAIALENNGSSFSYSSQVKIKDPHTLKLERWTSFPFKNAELKFVGRTQATYNYEVTMAWSFAGLEKQMKLTLELDTSGLSRNEVLLKVHPPLAAMMPAKMIDMTQRWVDRFLDLNFQSNLLVYFDRLPAPRNVVEGKSSLVQILIHAYNSRVPTRGPTYQPGDAVPVSEQIFLIITLAIWLVLVPVLCLVFFLKQHLSRRAGNRNIL